MKSFIGFVALCALVSSASAFGDSSRNCAGLEQVKAKAEQEVVAPYQRSNAVACVTQAVKSSAGDAVRDNYRLTYACKAAAAGARVTLIKVSFKDSERRVFSCSELADFTMATEVERTDREF